MKTSGLAYVSTGQLDIDPSHYMNATFEKGVSMLATLVEGRTQLLP